LTFILLLLDSINLQELPTYTPCTLLPYHYDSTDLTDLPCSQILTSTLEQRKHTTPPSYCHTLAPPTEWRNLDRLVLDDGQCFCRRLMRYYLIHPPPRSLPVLIFFSNTMRLSLSPGHDCTLFEPLYSLPPLTFPQRTNQSAPTPVFCRLAVTPCRPPGSQSNSLTGTGLDLPHSFH